MIAEIRHISLEEAERLRPDASTISALISIANPGSGLPDLKPGWASVLALQFDDVVPPLDALSASVYGPMTEAQASIVAGHIYALHVLPEAIHLVVHCNGGLNRSPAIAAAVHAELGVNWSNPTRAGNRWVFDLTRRALATRLGVARDSGAMRRG